MWTEAVNRRARAVGPLPARTEVPLSIERGSGPVITWRDDDAPAEEQPSGHALGGATPPGGRGAEALPAGPRSHQPRNEIEERSGAGATKHIRRFVVDHAPAVFLVPCGDPRCSEGGHNLTQEVMRALRASQTSFAGSDDCAGFIGPSACLRVVHFDGTARYRPVADKTVVALRLESTPRPSP